MPGKSKTQSLTSAPRERLAQVVGVCFDLDDTFTTEGLIRPEAFRALWAGAEAGLAMVPVTGRPAGWCDHLCRMWPVAGVVGENGAFWFSLDREARRVTRRWSKNEGARADDRARLEAVRAAVLEAVPRAAVAADQAYREADLAVDFAEDLGPLSDDEVDRIVEVFEAAGATAKISSIHVNGWFGAWNKRTTLLSFARERLSLSEAEARGKLVWIGDSPNDEPLFEAFELSFGVANVRRFLPSLAHPPRWITRREGGAGFAEVVRAVLRARGQTLR